MGSQVSIQNSNQANSSNYVKALDTALGIPRGALKLVGDAAELSYEVSKYVGIPLSIFLLADARMHWCPRNTACWGLEPPLLLKAFFPDISRNGDVVDFIHNELLAGLVVGGLSIGGLCGKRVKHLTYKMADALKLT